MEAYKEVLWHGARCVSLEIRDGKNCPEARLHDQSLNLEEVLFTIDKYAFLKSEMPLIISLEIHCNAANQRIAARLLVRVFQQRLLKSPIEEGGNDGRLPPLRSLRNRVILQGWKNLIKSDEKEFTAKALLKQKVRKSNCSLSCFC